MRPEEWHGRAPDSRDRDAEIRAFADRRGLAGEIRLPDAPREPGRDPRAEISPVERGSSPAPERGMFAGFTPRPIEREAAAEQKPRRGMFAGLKLSAEAAKPAPARADRGEDRAFTRAVERASRSAEAVLQARASGGPVLEHQKVALERTTETLDQLRPGASRDLASAMQRDPALLREAAAGRSGSMLDAMAQEARVRADPNLRADRFVERWQQLSQDRDRLYRAGDMAGREKAGKEMAGMAKSLERDPQVESILRDRTRDLGLEIGMNRGREMGGGELGRQLTQELGIGRDRGMSR
ncbi:hypothetical protein [Sphingobium sp. DEHP117]|uniref:hypothetical protein n=1 Tax=Sphingobium sp. DEHP117 TaxID=2993436 RepID=UPI00359FE6B4